MMAAFQRMRTEQVRELCPESLGASVKLGSPHGVLVIEAEGAEWTVEWVSLAQRVPGSRTRCSRPASR